MSHPDAIQYELGLTIVIAVGFWIWQTVDLKRAARELKDKEDAIARNESKPGANDVH